jgi:hypothetical protein
MFQRKRQSFTVSVSPNEILFRRARISVQTEIPLDAEYAQSAIAVRGEAGQVRLSKGGLVAVWEPATSLSPGHHTLIVGELVAQSGETIAGEIEIPFFVTDSAARVPSNLRVEALMRLRPQELGIERLPAHRRPSGAYIEVVKASDRKSGAPVELAFDEKGNRVDAQEVFARIAKRRLEKFGKLHGSLYRKLATIEPDVPIDVAIWIQVEDLPQEELKKLGEHVEEVPGEVSEFRERLHRELGQFAKDLAGTMDVQPPQPDPLAPVVYARLTADQIRAVEERPEVLGVFLYETDGIEDLDHSIAIANSDHAHALGYDGSGVKVAVWENGPDVTDDLDIEAFYDPLQTHTSLHARNTHGIVKNTEDGAPHGHAPGCSLYSANETNLAALRWAVKDQHCTVISQSFHRSSEPASPDLSYDDIYKDWLVVHWPYPTILQAAGNYWSTDPDAANPPGGTSGEYVNHKGYNSLAVGNHNDDASAMSGSTVFRNPTTPHGDRELPEICANGTGVTACGVTKSGTSMAAPAVAGCTALIQDVNSLLKIWPEGCRALLLAGSSRNVRDDTWWQDVIADVDARDGTGAVDAYESVRIAESMRSPDAAGTRRGWDVGTLRRDDFGDDGKSTFSYRVKVPDSWFGPRKVKVALAWNSAVGTFSCCGIESPISSALTIDLDLMIYDSEGNLVGYSGSWDNSYEIAEFVGESGETYTIRIRWWSGEDWTWFGIAWTVTGGFLFAERVVRNARLVEQLLEQPLGR